MTLLSVQNVGKAFRSYNSEWHRFSSWFGINIKPGNEQWVLRNVNFTMKKGETIGIVGQNGAGKSTLLKMIAGTMQPTEGRIQVDGRIAAILELGMGFNHELTGRQNAYHTAGLMGLTAEQTRQAMPAIEEFSEIGDYFDQPVRTYSSGMQMRVAFSVATIHHPDVLIIDEALSVGDAYFQQKSMRKIFELKESGVSILFVSHNVNSVKMLCDSAVLLDSGLMIDKGEPKDIINFYQNMILKKSHQGDSEFNQEKLKAKKDKISKSDADNSHTATTGEVELLDISFRDEYDKDINYIISEYILKICFTVKTSKYLEEPHYGIIIRNKYGISAFETNTFTMRQKTESLDKGESIYIEFVFECNLAAADYSVSVGVANIGFDRGSFEEYLLFFQDVEMIKVIQNRESIEYGGCTNLKPIYKSKMV